MSSESYTFGPYKIPHEEVFYSSQLSYAMVNLRPVVPARCINHSYVAGGTAHKLLCMLIFVACCYAPKIFILQFSYLDIFCGREVKRFVDLTVDETSDLWLTAQKIGSQLESYHKASSLTFSIQDGPQAGQTVPHVHIHILPRKGGDFEKNDEIYDAIDEKERDLKQKLDLDKERRDRSIEEMSQEADEYRKLL
ncbi:hypothetical protein CIPAW_13G059500 [Carya illinoinensis]|uniref:HIT domain-containing protein n=1 Tax=Carya illinoinensis TaxID=32201 RepID=A0A8T1NKY0_CARIL|nr:hypothetical protein CIPAW_13G059500 [Carya illinoinensis]